MIMERDLQCKSIIAKSRCGTQYYTPQSTI